MMATLSADTVRSTSLTTDDLIELRTMPTVFIDNLEMDYKGF